MVHKNMKTVNDINKPEHIGFLLFPTYAMHVFSLAVESLRLINRRFGGKYFEWTVLTPDGKPVAASNELLVTPQGSISDKLTFSTVFVLSGYDPLSYVTKPTLNWLRQQNRLGVQLGSFDTGAYFLAEAGLLDGKQVAVHWEALAHFKEHYPNIDASDKLFVIDGARITCSGGTGTLDLMLHLCALRIGKNLALEVAQDFIYTHIRSSTQDQRQAWEHQGITHPRLARIVRAMEHNIETPLSLKQLAKKVQLTNRQIERLCHSQFGESPIRYYTKLRLKRARQLLEQSELPILSIALAAGFNSMSAFSRAFSNAFESSPRAYRKRFRGQGLSRYLPGSNKYLDIDDSTRFRNRPLQININNT